LPDKDKPVIDDLLVLHVKHPRYGYRRITIKLREKGWFINFKRVYRLWCQEGFKIRRKQHKKLHIGCSENACNRKRPEYYNHIWSYDFLSERLENGRLMKLLVVIDEFTRECLAIDVNRTIKGPDVVEVLRYLFAIRPHSSLDYMAPAAFAAKCLEQGSATLRLPQDRENTCEILS
jgi:transposase InsO family protein